MKLEALLADEFRLQEKHKKALGRLGLETVEDLLYYFPARYGNTSSVKNIEDIISGEEVTIYGTISAIKVSRSFRTKVPMAQATVSDENTNIKCTWFNQPYIGKMIKDGQLVRISGKASERNEKLQMNNPEVEAVADVPVAVGNSLFGDSSLGIAQPVYRESRGVTSRWIFHTVTKMFKNGILDGLVDPVPEVILKKYSLPSLTTSLVWIHTPQREEDALSARKRFAFQEIFMIQLEKQKERKLHQEKESFIITKDKKDVSDFVSRFPFEATDAQHKAIDVVLEDFSRDYPMSRLLEGDVGSGKTAVAAASCWAAVTTQPKGKDYGALQVAYMAPTEILAEQHFLSFIEYFKHLRINIGLITSSGCKKFPSKSAPGGSTSISRAQLLKWVQNGEIPILIGTHSLIQKSVKFKNLAYIIIDEQHRFGTKQRAKLRQKQDVLPHLLSMTATPIPRTLALTIYGDLDITLLDQMPSGRKPIITEVVQTTGREATYKNIRKELEEGRQLYVICPRINEPDETKANAMRTKSVKAESKRLKDKVFPEYKIDILHSKQKKSEKEEVMANFSSGETDILVATSVIEVGVNVPNATMIIIEGAERFGLAQLHQLRGRVIRSNHQAYCYTFAETKTQKSLDRLKSLVTAKNGFELAEHDLAQRGAGDLAGRKQWGLSDLAMEAIKNIKMVEAAREEARSLIDEDPELTKHPLLANRLEEQAKIHFE